jgi:hypothetical protein
MRRGGLALAAGLLLVVIAAAATGAVVVWDVEATFDPPEDDDLYARSVSVDGDTAAIGAPGDDVRGLDAGAVWVHVRTADGVWLFQSKITAADGTPGDEFGESVAIDGNLLIVGAPEAGVAGRAYVFARGETGAWSQQAVLNPSSVEAGAGYGEAVAIQGTTAVVGRPNVGTGTVEVFERNLDGLWVRTTVLPTTTAAENDAVGAALAIDGDTIIVGAALDDTAGAEAGAAYVFSRTEAGAWLPEAKLFAGDGNPADLFGTAVDVSGDVAVVGARGNGDSGAAYVFGRQTDSTWSLQEKLTPAASGATGGAAVAVEDDRVVVGAPGAARVIVYEQGLGGWQQTQELEGGPLFGSHVDLWSDILLVGAPGPTTGSATVLRAAEVAPPPVPVAMFDPAIGQWHHADGAGNTNTFFYGIPGDLPLLGDWNCDGVDTVGMFRPSNGFVYLRNSNTLGVADIEFWYGIGGDIPVAGDWDGDGCDTIGVYRNGFAFLRNTLDTGVADLEFFYGIPTDTPFAGDFDGDGVDTLGLYRRSTGSVFFRNSNSAGFADSDFFYGIPGDQILVSDWDLDGDDTVAIFRSVERRFYISNENRQGFADEEFRFGEGSWIPVGGRPAPPG